MATTITVTIEKEDKDIVETYAKSEDLSVSQVVRKALKEFFERLKKESK